MSLPKDLTNRARVAKLLAYDPSSGIFTWKVARMHGHQPGAAAGSPGRDGYCTIMIDGKAYKAHRLAWLLHTGNWPKTQIDHINRVRDDNRIENLREATKSQNQINSGMYRNNKSGYRGVRFHKVRNKWVAEIRRNGRTRHLGLFATAKEAHDKWLGVAR
jgi:HNH endonuclease